MTGIRARLEKLLEAVADRIHEPGDDRARAAGLTVERLPGGQRRISDPRVPAWLEARRLRIARTGGDPLDRALAAGTCSTASRVTATGPDPVRARLS